MGWEIWRGRSIKLKNKKDVIAWAKTKKRVTTGYIQKTFNVGYIEASDLYAMLKKSGIIGRMGYVICKD